MKSKQQPQEANSQDKEERPLFRGSAGKQVSQTKLRPK
jgi:hypothetical protein